MLLHFLARLRYRSEVPDVPVFLDSPVAVDVTHLYSAHPEDHRLSRSSCVSMGRVPHHVLRLDQSRTLSANRFPMVVLAGSGMLSGGRMLHHVKAFGPDERNAIVLAGYQAPGTRGEALLKGARSLRIHGEDVPIRAEVVPLAGLSAHADCQDLVQWLETLNRPPRHVFINHGERENSEALRDHLVSRFGWNCTVAHHQGLVTLDDTQAWPTSGLSRT
jgi:metallo-beta-lactamase family protein